MSPKKSQYRTYKSDAAPFFFYIDVLPLDVSQYDIPHHVEMLKRVQSNPIMPLPLRVDRVFSGESTILIRPREPVSFLIDEHLAVINPQPFIQSGITKLLYFTEVRASREFASSLTLENAQEWWNSTKNLYGKLRSLEEDFVAFLKAYLHIMVKAKVNNEDLISAATKYCELIRDVCNQRIQEKYILVEMNEKEKLVDLYKMKEGKVYEKRFKRTRRELLYPTFVDIEVLDLEEVGYPSITSKNIQFKAKVIKYIPLLFYDDLLECMLQNLKILKDFEGKIIDPSFLIENNLIKLLDKETSNLEQYTWLKEFDEINIDLIMNTFEPTFPYDLR
jgi:hypothetical protein